MGEPYTTTPAKELQKALDLLNFDRLPATAVPALFAKLREMGVGCVSCRYVAGCRMDRCDGLCDEWEPTSPPKE